MYTPKQLKKVIGEYYHYVPPTELLPRYELLYRYGLLDDLDSMVFEDAIEITRFLQMFNRVSNEERNTLFFEGVDLRLIDMLRGDLSEIAPVLFDRVRLYQKTFGGTIESILSRFITSSKLLTKMHRSYFEEGSDSGVIYNGR